MYAKLFWAAPVAVAFVLAGALSIRSQDSTRIGVAEQIRTITSRIKSAEDRKQAEKALRHLDPATVLELVLPELERLEADLGTVGQFGGYLPPDKESPQPLQGYRILQGLWSDLINDPSHQHGALLLKLLKTAKSDSSRGRVISSFKRHYVPEAEAPLAAILRDKNAVGWSGSMAVLLHHRPEKYGPVVVDLMENQTASLARRVDLVRDFGIANFKRMEEKDRKRFIRTSFALVEADMRAQPNNKHAGYFPAVWVQGYLGIKLARPNMKDPKYLRPDGRNLNGEYFHDTALSALEWWRIHRKDYE